MKDLKDRRQFVRFAGVSVFGTVADYLLALLLASVGASYIAASTFGFVLGSFVNYCGHSIFSYEHAGRETISLKGFGKYFLAVMFSLVIRLAAVAGLEYATSLPFWLVLLIAIGASFVASYVISTLWVFRKPG